MAMSEINSARDADIRTQLQSIAAALRQVDHINQDGRQRLADLVEELSAAIVAVPNTSTEAIHLTDTAARLARAIQENDEAGVLETARRRLQKLIVSAKTDAPVLTGIAERLVRALSDIGI